MVDSVDSESRGLGLGRGLWGLTLHKEDVEPQHQGRCSGPFLMVPRATVRL